MKVSILIGFSYGEDSNINYVDNDRNPLPGIIVDLYQGYMLSKKMGADKILVITDIVRDQETSMLLKSMLDSTVDTKVLSFIEKIKSKKQYSRYTSRSHFIETIKRYLLGANQVLIYYTGHVSGGYLLFPMDGVDVDFKLPHNIINRTYDIENNLDVILKNPHLLKEYHNMYQNDPSQDVTKLSLISLRNIITSSIHADSEVFVIMDCCNSNGLNLPFKMDNGVYRLVQGRNSDFVKPKIICISSTMLDEDSITSRDGSIFTRSLFIFLKNCNLPISDLVNLVGKECSSRYLQTTTVHASHPNLKYIWQWVLKRNTLTIQIDNIKNLLVITPHKNIPQPNPQNYSQNYIQDPNCQTEDSNIQDPNCQTEDSNIQDSNGQDTNIRDINGQDTNIRDINGQDTNIQDPNIQDVNEFEIKFSNNENIDKELSICDKIEDICLIESYMDAE